ncbi:MAG: clostripain-related cysteine peptidase [Myxococcaceae bacterium]
MKSNGSGGQVSAQGGYEAGSIGATSDVLQVQDSVGATAFATVTIGPGLSIAPVNATTNTGGAVAFSAAGGSGTGFQFTIQTNATGANINVSTGAYVAGAIPGADIVRVSDSLGNIATTSVAVSSAIARWTVLVYVIADNNLETFALQDLVEMASPGSNATVKVLVEIDRSPEFSASSVLNQPNFTSTKRFQVNAGSLTQIADLGELDMGTSSTLADFITWGMQAEPAQHYALVLWDHGGGWKQFGVDDTNGHSGLTLGEVRQGVTIGLAGAGKPKFDVIGFDACLMATWETAYELRNLANVLVASEETEPGHGWDYSPMVTALRNISAITPGGLGQVIADGFKVQAAQNPTAAKSITLSVIDMSKMTGLVNAVNGLATVLNSHIGNLQGWIDVARARQESKAFGTPGPYDLVDLQHVAERAKAVIGTVVSSQADAVIAAVGAAVIYQVVGAGQTNAHGTSIYFALENSAYDPAYQALEIVSATSWDEFLTNFVTLQNTDTVPPMVGPVTVVGSTFSAAVTGNDIDPAQALLIVFEGAAGSRRLVAGLLASIAGGQVTANWAGAEFKLSVGAQSVTVPLMYGGKFTENLTEYSQLFVRAAYRDPTGSAFAPIVVRYLWDGTTLSFGGAFGGSGATSEVRLNPGGALHALQTIEQPGGFAEVEDTSVTLILGAGPPSLVADFGPAGSYDVGFSVADYAGNRGSSVATFTLSCVQDSQCSSQVGARACNVATGQCVQCTNTNPSACSGITPVCDVSTFTCAQCNSTNTSACSSSMPYCIAGGCVQCRTGVDCSNTSYVCVAGACSAGFGRNVRITVVSAAIPATDPGGSAWDALNGAPDPFVNIVVDGVSIGATTAAQDTWGPGLNLWVGGSWECRESWLTLARA